MSMNIAGLVSRNALYRPDHLAVIYENQRLTYRQYNQRVNQLANALLDLGVRKGDKIATILGNCLELLDIYWAGAKIGAVIVPLSPLLRGTGLTNLIENSDAVIVFTSADLAEVLTPLKTHLPAVKWYVLTDGEAEGYIAYQSLAGAGSSHEPLGIRVGGNDPYNIIYSSGTTGTPKGIVLPHRVRAMYCMQYAMLYRMHPESIVLHAGSLVFNGAFLTLMPAFYLGATYILHHHFDADLLIETVKREKVTHIKMVPSQIVAMLNSPKFSPEALQSLEMVGSVGAPLHMEHKTRLSEALPLRFYELYGLTEGFMTVLDKYDYASKPASVGVPPPFMEMRIVGEDGRDLPPGEIGEIVGKGPQLMSGYYKNPELTSQAVRDGWLHSGDLGYVDEDGFLYLVDRQKDMMISGGVNVYPRDIEEVAVQHPAVKEVAVFGIPDEKWGETPLAAVILKPSEQVKPDELKEWINERVQAKFQRVSNVVIMDDFPRSTAGKTLKRTLREPYWQHKKTAI